MRVMWRRGSKVVQRMDNREFQAELNYQICVSLAESLMKKGLLTGEEYAQIDTILLAKYRPQLSMLLSGKP